MFVKSSQYASVCRGNFVTDSSLISSNSRQSDFCTRLCLETDYTYRLGGVVCLLTLTYSNSHLPYAFNPVTRERFSCFSRSHIRQFLNLLKVRMYRAGVSYKYFICCEYGDRTKRPHYHLLGFLHDKKTIKVFLDTVREIWCHGIVFPAPFGNPYEAAVLRSPRNGAAYASKYVCKDVSFWSLPALKRYVDYIAKQSDDDYILSLKDALPRLYESNGIGCSGLDQFSDFGKILKGGLFNPLTKKFTKIPTYLLNKYLYDFVPAFNGRVGKKNKRLYDRVLRASYDDLFAYKMSVFNSYESKVRSLLAASVSDFDYRKFYSLLKSLSDSLSIDSEKSVSYVCRYASFVRLYSSSFAEQFFNIHDLFDFDVIKEFVCLNADTERRFALSPVRSSAGSVASVFTDYQDVFFCLDECVSMFDVFFTAVLERRISDMRSSWELSRKLKKLNFDPNLC